MYHLFQPYTALFNMDKVVSEALPFRCGVYIEVGANDGVTQSNTNFLGRRRGWTGILIEPVPWLARTARRWRPEAIVVEACVTSPSLAGKLVDLIDLDLVSQIGGRFSESDLPVAPKDALLARSHLLARTTTLTSVIEDNNLGKVDFLSIDVERHEIHVLMGLDLSKHQPTLILVETTKLSVIQELLHKHYRFVSALSHHDYLFERSTDFEQSVDGVASTTH